MQNNIPLFYGRPSALGQIMTNARGKSNEQVYQELLSSIKEDRKSINSIEKPCAVKYNKAVQDLHDTQQNMLTVDKKDKELLKSMKENEKSLKSTVKEIEKNMKSYFNARSKITNKLVKLREMEETRDKPNLSKTCISYVEKWMKEQLYGIEISFSNKYTKKGIELEDASIEYISKVFGWENVEKNTKKESNAWIKGECDIKIGKKFGADVKNSYSHDTFPLFDEEIPTDGYELQLQGYADLYGFERLRLVYVLMDATEEMIDDEARKEMYKRNLPEVTEELFNEVAQRMTYSHLPDELRVKWWDFERDNDKINSIHVRVEEIRLYIDKYTNFNELYAKLKK